MLELPSRFDIQRISLEVPCVNGRRYQSSIVEQCFASSRFYTRFRSALE